MQGGFVSGRMLAALPDASGDAAAVVQPNEYYLTVPGLQQLASVLETGKYRVQVWLFDDLLLYVLLSFTAGCTSRVVDLALILHHLESLL